MSEKAKCKVDFFNLTKQERVALWSFAEALKHRDVCVSVYIGKKSMSVTVTPWEEKQK